MVNVIFCLFLDFDLWQTVWNFCYSQFVFCWEQVCEIKWYLCIIKNYICAYLACLTCKLPIKILGLIFSLFRTLNLLFNSLWRDKITLEEILANIFHPPTPPKKKKRTKKIKNKNIVSQFNYLRQLKLSLIDFVFNKSNSKNIHLIPQEQIVQWHYV